jgi:fructose-1-phosphate kinase PfkB-like protein
MVTRRRPASTDLSAVAGPLCIGVDVSKDWLDIADTAGRAVRIANTVAAITEALAGKPWLDPGRKAAAPWSAKRLAAMSAP